MSTKLLQSLALGLLFGLVSCGSDPAGADETGGGPGGSGPDGSGNTTTGGGDNVAAAGSASVGTSAGGTAMGGTGGGAAGGDVTPSGCTMSGTPPSGGMSHCSANASGNVGAGYSYNIWSSGTGACVIPYGVGAAFKATWKDSGDLVARVGLDLGSSKTPAQIGIFSADYAETKTGTDGGASFIGIYGWSEDPLHEYYIVDDWFGSRPQWGEKVGEVQLDGGTYDILTHTQVNQPSITGSNATFVQFWSMRQTPRQCGHISITEHFKAWANMGMTLGKMEECRIVVEVVGGAGSIDFTSATLVAK